MHHLYTACLLRTDLYGNMVRSVDMNFKCTMEMIFVCHRQYEMASSKPGLMFEHITFVIFYLHNTNSAFLLQFTQIPIKIGQYLYGFNTNRYKVNTSCLLIGIGIIAIQRMIKQKEVKGRFLYGGVI